MSVPSVSRMAYSTVDRSVTLWRRSSSVSSSTENRQRCISFWLIVPFSMRKHGLPKSAARSFWLRSVTPERMSSRQKSVRIETRPFISGMPISCRGSDAKSATSTETTSSDSSSSPSCRFPRMRMHKSSTVKMMMVRNITIAIEIF